MTDGPRTVYIAGPMTGYPDYNYPAFHSAAAAWRFYGWDVNNPAENFGGDQSLPYETYLEQALKDVEASDAIALLPGWEKSDGARREVNLALSLGLRVFWADRPASYPYQMSAEFVQSAMDYAAEVVAKEQANEGRPSAMDFTGVVDGKGYKTSMDNPAKPHLALVPTALITAAGRAFTHGANKYAPNNWRRGMVWTEAYSALLRHLTAWGDGEDIDPDSGNTHLDHAAAALGFLCEFVAHPELYGKFDNRFKRPSTEAK